MLMIEHSLSDNRVEIFKFSYGEDEFTFVYQMNQGDLSYGSAGKLQDALLDINYSVGMVAKFMGDSSIVEKIDEQHLLSMGVYSGTKAYLNGSRRLDRGWIHKGGFTIDLVDRVVVVEEGDAYLLIHLLLSCLDALGVEYTYTGVEVPSKKDYYKVFKELI